MSQPYSIYHTGDGSVMDRRTDGVAVSSTTTYYSSPISCSRGDGFSLTLKWTGTPTGTFTVWRSDLPQPALATDDDWVQDTDYGTAGSVTTGGTAGKHAASALNAKNRWWRVKYVNSSGTGTIFAYATTNRTV